MAGDNKTTMLLPGASLGHQDAEQECRDTDKDFHPTGFSILWSTALTVPECTVCILTQKSSLRGKRTGFLRTEILLKTKQFLINTLFFF